MKARAVPGLKPRHSLAESSARIVAVRLDELHSLAFDALEPEAWKRQHDMRIAAKRLRYVLEVTGFCLGAEAEAALAAARALQEVLGDLHDCDEMEARIGAHLTELRAGDASVVRGAAGGDRDLRPELAVYAPNRNAYRGLNVLSVYVQARRILLFERFAELWSAQSNEGVWVRLEEAAARTLDGARRARKTSPQ